MPVGTFTESALLTPSSAVALLLRACGPRIEVMEASGRDVLVGEGDSFASGCAG